MSAADSPRRSRIGGPLVVTPQPPADRSLMEAVSGFINDVTLTSAATIDSKDAVQWARFECADVNEPTPEGEGGSELSPLLLVVGYGSGVQVWLIPPHGDAQEVLSWRQGAVRLLRILPTPSDPDNYSVKRPLIALCDSAGPGPPFCSLSFISLRGGDQVKSIKFKNPVLDVLANKRSIVVSFSERLAVFDACTLEDRLTVTTCFPSPCPLGSNTPTNPVALGDRWLAYSERKLIPNKRSSGGCEGEGVTSYTATVLHAAKSLGKGLRGLGESVASSLAGGKSGTCQSPSPPHSDQLQPGIVTVLDIESSPDDDIQDVCEEAYDPMVAHFVAHSDAIVALKFDASGMLLVTADKRGHDFHVFRIHPHLSGPSLASVHHLYILHRGDTTAKVQDISLSVDSRWAAVSTLRGTVHVYTLTPYGGPCGVRTHAQPRVVNRLSRFHRSAGLTPDGRSHSPVGESLSNASWYPNPRLPPYPTPTVVSPLAQLRPTPNGPANVPTHTITRNSSGRQRLSSLSEDGCAPLCVRAFWGMAVSCAQRTPRVATSALSSTQYTPSQGAHALYIMSAHGLLLYYVVTPRPLAGIPKEKIGDDSPIELDVEVRSQWSLNRPPNSPDLTAPLPHSNPLLGISIKGKDHFGISSLEEEDRWLSQVEIVTHAGPHRRLWMGPQFVFKTYNTSTGSSLSLLDVEAVEVGTGPSHVRSNPVNIHHSSPVNIQHSTATQRPIVPVLIESGSASSLEHSPRMSDAYRKPLSSESANTGVGSVPDSHHPPQHGDVRLREDLAEAMKETDQGCELMGGAKGDPLRGHHVRRVVNPLGTVVSGNSSDSGSPPTEDPDIYTHANEDESLFRPVVRAPKSLPPPCEMETQPLSTCTVIPAKRIQPQLREYRNGESPIPLKSDVIIPAALSDACLEETNISEPAVSPEFKVRLTTQNIMQKVKNIEVDSTGSASKLEDIEIKICSSKKKNTTNAFEASEQNISTKEKELDILETYKLECIDDELSKAKKENKFHDVSSNPGSIKEDGQVSSAQSKGRAISPVEIITDETEPSLRTPIILSDDFSVNTDVCSANLVAVETCSDLNFCDIEAEANVSESFTVTLPVPSKRKSKKIEIVDNIDNDFEAIKTEEQAWEMLSNNTNAKTLNAEIPIVIADSKSDVIDTIKMKVNKRNRKSKTKIQADITSVDAKQSKVDVFNNEGKKNSTLEVETSAQVSTLKSWSAVVGGASKILESDCGGLPNDEFFNEVETIPSKLSSLYNLNDVVVAMCDVPEKELCFFDEHHTVFEEPPPLEPIDLTFEDKYSSNALFDIEQELVIENNDRIGIKEVEEKILYMDSTKDNCDENTANSYRDILKCKPLEEQNDSPSPANLGEDIPKVIITHSVSNKGRSFECANVMDKSSDEENVSPSSSQTESDDCFPRLAKVITDETAETGLSETQITNTVITSLQKSNKKKSKRKRR